MYPVVFTVCNGGGKNLEPNVNLCFLKVGYSVIKYNTTVTWGRTLSLVVAVGPYENHKLNLWRLLITLLYKLEFRGAPIKYEEWNGSVIETQKYLGFQHA